MHTHTLIYSERVTDQHNILVYHWLKSVSWTVNAGSPFKKTRNELNRIYSKLMNDLCAILYITQQPKCTSPVEYIFKSCIIPERSARVGREIV